ncbi:hypothetical protein BamMEX5DRAFT_4113 [Burkholderia ambifaria MEX-5]|uniref:Uncharacterized protein n=1 Tax=Burkholderia ambifaria MEX-5 TaxID=396597 RepID=B1T8J7_9BURK|nr:hypothetical protein BamMEX5DRAFT_4113 [Burkholderia ambifaria MEX-5]
MTGFRHDARVVAARRQDEGQRVVREQMELVDGAPRRHVIALGADHERRHVDIRQRDRPPVDAVAADREIVVEKEPRQVFRMHAIWHARGVRIPRHQVVRLRARAEQVFAHHPRPDQVARIQQLERGGHLRAVQVALPPHQRIERGQFARVDEQAEFAGFAEIGLGRQQRDGPQCFALPPVARERRRNDRQQRAAETIADRVNGFAGDRPGGIERRHAPVAQIVVEPEVARLRTRVAPRHGKHGVAGIDQETDQRIVRLQIEDVVLHDPRRHDQDRLVRDPRRRRLVLQQFAQRVAPDDAARRDGHVASRQIRSRVMCMRAAGTLELRLRILQPVQGACREIRAAAGHRRVEHDRIGRQEIARRARVEPLSHRESDQFLMVPLDARHAARRVAPPALDRQEAVTVHVKRPSGPRGRREARIGLARVHRQARRVRLASLALAPVCRRCNGSQARLHREIEAFSRRHREMRAPVEHGQRQRHGRQPERHRRHVRMRRAVPLFCGGCNGLRALGRARLGFARARWPYRFVPARGARDGRVHQNLLRETPPLPQGDFLRVVWRKVAWEDVNACASRH